jgi:chromosome segregation ATPase
VDQIKEEIVIANERIIESRVVKLEMERDITKLEDSLSEGDRKLKELDNEIQQFKKAIEQKEIIICETKTVFKNLKWYLFRLILILSY